MNEARVLMRVWTPGQPLGAPTFCRVLRWEPGQPVESLDSGALEAAEVRSVLLVEQGTFELEWDVVLPASRDHAWVAAFVLGLRFGDPILAGTRLLGGRFIYSLADLRERLDAQVRARLAPFAAPPSPAQTVGSLPGARLGGRLDDALSEILQPLGLELVDAPSPSWSDKVKELRDRANGAAHEAEERIAAVDRALAIEADEAASRQRAEIGQLLRAAERDEVADALRLKGLVRTEELARQEERVADVRHGHEQARREGELEVTSRHLARVGKVVAARTGRLDPDRVNSALDELAAHIAKEPEE